MNTDIKPADGSGAMFDAIAARYDLLNRLMSFGLDRRWRRQLVDALDLPQTCDNAQVLDVATGTGDVALAVLARYNTVRVTGLDPSGNMLELAAKKRAKHAYAASRFSLVQGDAQKMPFVDNTFAAACISFGIRNVPDRLLGLTEMARVVQPSGTVAVLELGEPQDGLMKALARFHVHTLVPMMGRLLSGAKAYDYLQESIARFPSPQVFSQLMGQAGLQDIRVRRLNFGAVHLYTGRVR